MSKWVLSIRKLIEHIDNVHEEENNVMKEKVLFDKIWSMWIYIFKPSKSEYTHEDKT